MKTIKMIMRKRLSKVMGALMISFLFLSLLSSAQEANNNRWSLEIRTGVNFATEKLGGVDVNTGFGGEIVLGYRFMEHLGVYGGWGWNQFSTDADEAGYETDFEETGYTYGLQFIHPIGDSRINYLLRAGGLWNHIEVENAEGDITHDTGHGLGWQAELGLAVTLGNHIMIQPGIRYRSLPGELEPVPMKTNMDLKYFSAGLGISWLF